MDTEENYHIFNKLVFETIELCHVNIPLGLQGFSRNRRATITSLINLLSKTTELSHFPVRNGAYMWEKMPGLMGYAEEWISCII